MARPRKKPDYDPEQVVKEFLGAVADAFGSYDDRNPGGSAFPGLNAVAVAFGMTALKARKLLITAGVYSTEMSRRGGEAAGGRVRLEPDDGSDRPWPGVRSFLPALHEDSL